MKIRLLITCLMCLIYGAAHAADYPQKNLQTGAIICFERSDWTDMVAAAVDDDDAAATRLIASGACRVIQKPAKVLYLDRIADESGVIIQMPSGKAAYTSDKFLK